MAPAVYDSTVYVSTVAGQHARRSTGAAREGILFALDAATGATLWQFDTTTDNLWGNPRINSGGGLWYPAVVRRGGNLYFGVGNAAPWRGHDRPTRTAAAGPAPTTTPARSSRSIRATGALRWYSQRRPARPLRPRLPEHADPRRRLRSTAVHGRLAIGSGKTGTVLAVKQTYGDIVWQTAVGLHQQ